MAAGGRGPLAPDGRLPFGASGRPGCLFPFCEGRARALAAGLAAGKLAMAPGEGLGPGLLSGRGTSLDAADCAWEGAGAASLATPVGSLFTCATISHMCNTRINGNFSNNKCAPQSIPGVCSRCSVHRCSVANGQSNGARARLYCDPKLVSSIN